MPPPGGYAAPFPAPGLPPLAPSRSGAAAAFKWGAIFGVVAGVVNLAQVLIGVAVVNGNLNSIDSYESSPEFQAYLQCLQSGSSSNCQVPTQIDTTGLSATIFGFYGSCCAIFLLTLVVYLFAARFAAKEAARRGPGIWAAIIAATVGSILYIIFGVVAISLTGRSALLGGLGPFSPQIDSGTWAGALSRATIIIDGVALLVTAGIAALMGLGGAALGLRGLPPPAYPGYPGYMMPPPGVPPFAPPPPYGSPPPMYAPYPPPGTTGAQPGAQPGAAPTPAPDYTLPAQYPPLPSQYETPAAGGPSGPSGQAPGTGASGTTGITGTTDTTDTTGNPGNA